MCFWVQLTNTRNHKLFCCLLIFFLNPLVILVCESFQILHCIDVLLLVGLVIFQFECMWPINLVQIQKHPLLNFTFSVVYRNWVIVLIKTTSNGHEWGLCNMSNVRSRLSWFNALHDCLRVYRSECINHYFTFHRLYWINDYTYCPGVEHLLRFLSLNIGSWQPATETWMWMVPSNSDLVSSDLLHHVHEFLLINRVNGLYTNCGTSLRHRENIYYCNRIVIMDFSNH